MTKYKMREILFRGKDDESGKFVYGYYGLERDMRKKIPFILKPSISWEEEDILFSSFVIPETVGQFTGLTDKIGTKIFEGDIVKCRHEILHIDFYPDKRDIRPRRSYNHEIAYDNDFYKTDAYLEYWRNYEVRYNDNGGYKLINGSDHHKFYDTYIRNHEIVVIGNIHDNSELLKEPEGVEE